MNTTAYSYIRCSTKEQLKGNTVARQLEAAEAYAKKNGLFLSEQGYEDLGISAFHGKNLEEGSDFFALITAIEKHVIPEGSTLIIESLDRLSRDFITKSLPMFMRILNAGVRVVTLSDGKLYDKNSVNKNPMDLMFSIMVLSRANEESEMKRIRISDAWQKAQKKAGDKFKIANSYPNWLSLEDDKFSVIKPKAELVKWIFQRSLAGDSTGKIARTLNTQKKLTPNGKAWVQTTIKFLLKNPAVIGEYHAGKREKGKKVKTGHIVKGYYPAIISENDFYRVQAKFKLNPTKIGRPQKEDANLFSGIIKCPYCHGSMGINNAKESGSFICWNSVNGGCLRVAIPVNFIERAVVGSTGQIAESMAVAELDLEKIEKIEGEVAEIKKKVANLVRLVADGADVEEAADLIKSLRKTQLEKETKLKQERSIDEFKKTQADKTVLKVFSNDSTNTKARLAMIPHIRRYVKLVEPYFVGDSFDAYKKAQAKLIDKGLSGGAFQHILRKQFDVPNIQYVKITFAGPVRVGKKAITSCVVKRSDNDITLPF